tara:strand:- start:1318 stop:1911 length:594 start_codon:yes stop_codon:yes gene_type:complete
MSNKVKLYGELADFIGYKELDAVINSTADAISFLITNFPKLEAHMSNRYYQVLVGDYELSKDDIQNPIGKSDIHIVPVIVGAGGGAGKFILGAVLIGVGFAVGGGLFGAALAKNLGAIGLVKNIGLGLALSGVSEMLFPVPPTPDFKNEEDPRISFSFSGIQNTSRAGTSHPIVYGEIVTGSVVISAGIDTNQVVSQ